MRIKGNRKKGGNGVLFTDNKILFGVKIEEVIPLLRMWVCKGDIVTHADDRRIKSKEALLKIIGKRPSDIVKMQFHRNENIRDILILLIFVNYLLICLRHSKWTYRRG